MTSYAAHKAIAKATLRDMHPEKYKGFRTPVTEAQRRHLERYVLAFGTPKY